MVSADYVRCRTSRLMMLNAILFAAMLLAPGSHVHATALDSDAAAAAMQGRGR